MSAMNKTAITPTRSEDYAEWYQAVIAGAEMAENSPVRGCMVIRPWGYGIWEELQQELDRRIKATGHVNAYFPLLIPLSFLAKEAEHVDGFAKECAVVTHHRLEVNPEGKLIPAGELEEPYVIRPTSETIIGAMYAKWVQSYRDLPILINQWANVMRWEMRTRLFLRTSEFLWQEGHTAHASKQEAIDETYKMLHVYADFAEEVLAIAVVRGEKPCWERFPGAVNTYSIEAMMQDRKALQAGTSHFLGQNFAKASNIQFSNKAGEIEHAWTTSWGVSTRLIGGLVMVHGDDNGLIIPPRVAPSHMVILPIYRNDEERELVLAYCEKLEKSLREKTYFHQPLRVIRDDREMRGGDKTWQWVKKGIPLRLEIGPRDVAANSVFMARRDKDPKDKQSISSEALLAQVSEILSQIQDGLLAKSRDFLATHTQEIHSFEAFKAYFTPVSQDAEKPEMHGGFAEVFALDSKEIEDFIKPLKVTGRCMPLNKNSDENSNSGTCIFTGKPGAKKMIFSKAY
jgi:prolyl-tRNA synthetase